MIICDLINLIGGILASLGLFDVAVLGDIVESILIFFEDINLCPD